MNKLLLLFVMIAFAACMTPMQKAKSKFDSAEYQTAIGLYQKQLKLNPPDAAQINYQIGECYRLSNRVREAVPYYRTALEGKVKASKLNFYMGYALKANEQYEEAIAYFEKYAKAGGDPNFVQLATQESKNLKAINDIRNTPSYTTISNLENLNTEAGEFSPVMYGEKLIFASDRKKEKVFETTGTGFQDLYAFNFTDTIRNTGAVQDFFNENINLNGHHEAEATFARNGKLMIFARSNSGQKKEPHQDVNLFSSRLEDGQWTVPELLDKLSIEEAWDACPALSPDGKTLYFSSNRKGGSMGGNDIYISRLNEGSWSKPQNLGKLINTAGDEMFPYVAPDGRFFFASSGHAGLGGLDIFVLDTVKVGMDSLTKKPILQPKVRNVGTPMNSIADDFGVAYKSRVSGYFSSNRAGGKGDDDIYYFYNDSSEVKKTVTYYLRGVTYSTNLKNEQKTLSSVSVRLTENGGTFVDSLVSDVDGKFSFPKPIFIGKIYELNGQKISYLSGENTLSTVGRGVDVSKLPNKENIIYFDTELVLRVNEFDIPTENGKRRQPLELEILYEYDSARITADAGKLLDEFAAFLLDYYKEFPNTVIELGSHTDERGSAVYNRKLAQRRADSAVRYLTTKGIPIAKMIAKGYGEDQPKIKGAKTEAQHQTNRRTTVRITKQ
ncbi:MAG: outer membrane peptidoglycan-associated lipoprotein [Cytophagales bacterium]|nr:MAG: outer membrane peptidoglycan-associated lipoprotein [Cytophagales bacterium]